MVRATFRVLFMPLCDKLNLEIAVFKASFAGVSKMQNLETSLSLSFAFSSFCPLKT